MPSRCPAATTLGELRASDHEYRGVRAEIAEHLILALSTDEPRFDGLVGLENTVLPQLERALLAGHDVVLLGERGQGKTKLARSVVNFLDEWTPVITGCEINDHPFHPICAQCVRLADELGEDMPVSWRHRNERLSEKLATPDTSVADLIGDVDPIKVAEGRTLGDPETIHFGLVPRTNRGVVVINELPDLAERIQVSLLNILQEQDIQIRGYTIRVPMDVVIIATANPEDYTNRGRIITPLKDRFGAEIRTHYPNDLETEIDLISQEARMVAEVPRFLLEVIARFTREVRSHDGVDPRSGVSARFAIAVAECASASALRRHALTNDVLVARPCDVVTAVPISLGKVEFETAYEGREHELADHLMKLAFAQTFRERLSGVDLTGFSDAIRHGAVVETGDMVTSTTLLSALGTVNRSLAALSALGVDEPTKGTAASASEFILEGLYLTRRLGKAELDGGRVQYGVEEASAHNE